jgi:hypothetical protein
VSDGGTGETTIVGAQNSLEVGLVRISPGSISHTGGSVSASSSGEVSFTSVTTISLDNIFSSSFANYRMVFRGNFAGTDAEMRFRYRTSGGSDVVSNYQLSGIVVGNNASVAYPSGGGVGYAILGQVSSGVLSGGFAVESDFFDPFLSRPSRNVFAASGSNGTQHRWSAGNNTHTNSTSYPSITFFASSGSFSGTMRFYGYNS